MTTMLYLAGLPVPPSLNNAYTQGRGHGRRVLTEEGRAFKQETGLRARLAASAAGFEPDPRAARLALTMRLYFPRDNRDGDNAIKLLQDAICEGLGINDRRVKEWHVYADVDRQRPRTDVVVEVLP